MEEIEPMNDYGMEAMRAHAQERPDSFVLTARGVLRLIARIDKAEHERRRFQKTYKDLASKAVWRDDDWDALEELRSAIAHLPGGSGSGGPAYLMSLAAKLVTTRKRLCRWTDTGTTPDDPAHYYKTECGNFAWSEKTDYCPHCGGRVIDAANGTATRSPNDQDQGREASR